MLRAAVERKFEIIGEALSKRFHGRFSDSLTHRQARQNHCVSNILIQGCAEIDDRLVWDMVENKLPVLRREVDELLAKA